MTPSSRRVRRWAAIVVAVAVVAALASLAQARGMLSWTTATGPRGWLGAVVALLIACCAVAVVARPDRWERYALLCGICFGIGTAAQGALDLARGAGWTTGISTVCGGLLAAVFILMLVRPRRQRH